VSRIAVGRPAGAGIATMVPAATAAASGLQPAESEIHLLHRVLP